MGPILEKQLALPCAATSQLFGHNFSNSSPLTPKVRWNWVGPRI